MATATQRATAILEALADGNLSAAERRDVAEGFTNTAGAGGNPESLYDLFLQTLGRTIRQRVAYNGEKTKRSEAREMIKAAGKAAEDKVPGGIPRNVNGNRN